MNGGPVRLDNPLIVHCDLSVLAEVASPRFAEARGGSGVVVLPCGAGKTLVGMGCMAELGTSTLILTMGVTSTRQWIEELLERTTLRPEDVGEYTGERKDIRPVTITTYQILTHRASKDAPFTHLELFDRRERVPMSGAAASPPPTVGEFSRRRASADTPT